MEELKKAHAYCVGELVRATAGRESGGLFLVCWAEGRYVGLCDGKTRKLSNIKRKNIRHVIPTGLQSKQLAAARAVPSTDVMDADIRKEIKRLSEEVL